MFFFIDYIKEKKACVGVLFGVSSVSELDAFFSGSEILEDTIIAGKTTRRSMAFCLSNRLYVWKGEQRLYTYVFANSRESSTNIKQLAFKMPLFTQQVVVCIVMADELRYERVEWGSLLL